MQTRNGLWTVWLPICLLVLSSAHAGTGKLQLVSHNLAGESGRGASSNWDTVITPDGRYVVFASNAPDLATTLPLRHPNLYRRDMLTGEMRLVTEANGRPVGGSSPSVSSDGRFVAFSSPAEEYTPLDRNRVTDVYLRDMETGVVTLISVHPGGTAGVRASFNPKLSADGRYVVFESVGSSLVDVSPGGGLETINIFRRDTQTKTTRLVSINGAANASGNADSRSPAVSSDGRYVAFLSEATNLVASNDGNGQADLFVRDMDNGVTELVSLAHGGNSSASAGVTVFAMTPDGRHIAFSSYANDIVSDEACGGVYLRDLQRKVTRRVSCAVSSGLGVSANGRFVPHGDNAIYRTDIESEVTDLVTVNRDGTGAADGPSGYPSISADGRFVAFVSEAGDLSESTDVAGRSRFDVFVRDMQIGVTHLASGNPSLNRSGNRPSFFPVMSAAGNAVTFHSAASDLARNDGNGLEDVFLFQVPQDASQNLVYPRLTRARGETTGFAVSNPGPDPALLTLTAFSPSGSLVQADRLQNPRHLELPAKAQVALVDADVFGPAITAVPGPVWVRLESSNQIVGFYLIFNQSLRTLDGADALLEPRARLVFPEIWTTGFTEVHLVNPSEAPADIALDIMTALGLPRTSTFHARIGAGGSLAANLADLFPGVTPAPDDYILVAANPAVVGLEYFGEEGRYTAAVNGREGTIQDRGQQIGAQLIAPQYAQGPTIATHFSVINLEDREGFVDFVLYPDGAPQPLPVRRVDIPAKGKLRIDDPAFFGWTGTGFLTGFVAVSSPLQVTGSVSFGDFERFASALPLVDRSPRELIFSHVASDETFFTGLAVVNYSANWTPEALVTIEVVGPDGLVLASKTETFELGTRKSQLITEYFPELSARALRYGYIRVSCPEGVAAFALFGTWNLSALSAIPGQIVR